MEELIYDRILTDVLEQTNKGYHNYTDLNRIEEWCEYIANLLTSYGYAVRITVKKDWTMLDDRTELHTTRILNNVKAIRDAFTTMSTTPATPTSINPIDYIKANDIEKILADINQLIINMESAWKYSGDIISGEGYMS